MPEQTLINARQLPRKRHVEPVRNRAAEHRLALPRVPRQGRSGAEENRRLFPEVQRLRLRRAADAVVVRAGAGLAHVGGGGRADVSATRRCVVGFQQAAVLRGARRSERLVEFDTAHERQRGVAGRSGCREDGHDLAVQRGDAGWRFGGFFAGDAARGREADVPAEERDGRERLPHERVVHDLERRGVRLHRLATARLGHHEREVPAVAAPVDDG